MTSTNPSGPWKCGREFLPYHPAASHVDPSYRDGWNHCYQAALVHLPAVSDSARAVANGLPFTIDGPAAPIRVLRERSGSGCRPASAEECALWDALQACLQATA